MLKVARSQNEARHLLFSSSIIVLWLMTQQNYKKWPDYILNNPTQNLNWCSLQNILVLLFLSQQMLMQTLVVVIFSSFLLTDNMLLLFSKYLWVKSDFLRRWSLFKFQALLGFVLTPQKEIHVRLSCIVSKSPCCSASSSYQPSILGVNNCSSPGRWKKKRLKQ